MSALALGARALRRAPIAVGWSWTWRAVASLAPVVAVALLADRIGGRGGIALLVLAVLHQCVVLSRVALRASWLAKAMRTVDRLEPDEPLFALRSAQAHFASERPIELLVAARRAFPAAIESHHAPHERAPARLRAGREGSLGRAEESVGRGLLEEKPGARLELRVAVDDRVDEPPGGARHRERAIALRVQLDEPARLVATRHEHHVGRGEHPVHQRFARRPGEHGPSVRLGHRSLDRHDQRQALRLPR